MPDLNLPEPLTGQSYRRMLHALHAAWWVIVLGGMFGALFAFGLALLQSPSYSSTATLYVTSGSDLSLIHI